MKIISIAALFASLAVPSTDAVGFRGPVEKVKTINKGETATAETKDIVANPEDLTPRYGPDVDPSDQSFLVMIPTDAVGFRGLVEEVEKTNKAQATTTETKVVMVDIEDLAPLFGPNVDTFDQSNRELPGCWDDTTPTAGKAYWST
mmetsp:Transcript_24411/g.42753  ORF Transcript_24411/g.42753 Transcript_24411/m.42753 type:complete len:146 (-) Transcript_24411:826-1263(-)